MRYRKKQVPCQRLNGVESHNSFIFKQQGEASWRELRGDFQLVVALSQSGGFRPIEARFPSPPHPRSQSSTGGT